MIQERMGSFCLEAWRIFVCKAESTCGALAEGMLETKCQTVIDLKNKKEQKRKNPKEHFGLE